MRSMNAVLLDWPPKRMAHVRVATALFETQTYPISYLKVARSYLN